LSSEQHLNIHEACTRRLVYGQSCQYSLVIDAWVYPAVRLTVQGVTAIHLAAQNGHTDVVSLLLSRSAGLLRIADKHGRTPLHLSASHGHYDMSLLLIGQGADIDAYDKVGIFVELPVR